MSLSFSLPASRPFGLPAVRPVLLLNPPHPQGIGFTREGRCTQESGVWATQWPPLSLATAGACLEAEGRRPKIIDCPAVDMTLSALAEQVQQLEPSWIFISTATPTLDSDLAAAARLKRAAPYAHIGVLGTHVTAEPETALAAPGIDMVIRAEPEGTIADLCRVGDGWRDVHGISFRDPDSGGVCHRPDRPWLDPARIPAPAWHLLDLTPYRLPLKGRPFLMVAPVRGCPFRCTFCTAPDYYGRTLRLRPVRQVVDEIEAGTSRFGIRDFFIWADTFTASRRYVSDFCREIRRRRLVVDWTCNSRVDTVDEALLAEMKRAGCWMISFGMESADEEVLSRSKKQITARQSAEAASAARKAGLVVSGHFIFGLPADSHARMEKTLSLALSLPIDIAQFYAASPFPGTDLFREASESGWLRSAGGCSQSRSCMDLPGLSAEQVDEFRHKAFRAFYFRPTVILRLLSMVRPRALPGLVNTFARFSGWTKLLKRHAT